jgi:hypothetical protein
MARRPLPRELTPEQQAEAQRIRQNLLEAAADDIRELSELLAATDDAHLFGATEFTVRDIVHRIGAKAVAATLEGRKKGGTTARRVAARSAPKPPASNAGAPGRS